MWNLPIASSSDVPAKLVMSVGALGVAEMELGWRGAGEADVARNEVADPSGRGVTRSGCIETLAGRALRNPEDAGRAPGANRCRGAARGGGAAALAAAAVDVAAAPASSAAPTPLASRRLLITASYPPVSVALAPKNCPVPHWVIEGDRVGDPTHTLLSLTAISHSVPVPLRAPRSVARDP